MDDTEGIVDVALLSRMTDQPEYSLEADLLEACRRQDIRAFETLYRMQGTRLKNIAYHIVGNRQDAEDAVQETFLRSYRSIKGFRGQCSLGTWLCRIVINVCYDMTRKRRPESEFKEDCEHTKPGITTRLALETAIRQLNPNYRTVFLLFAVEGMTHAEIASILEIPTGTSKSWLFEARKELQRILEVHR